MTTTHFVKIHVQDRYRIVRFTDNDPDSVKTWDLGIDPLQHTLFDQDVFTIQEDPHTITIVESPIRQRKQISGVLQLQQQKTLGRHKNNKLLYACIPDDLSLPPFIVPYDMKTMGFSKQFSNLFVLFVFQEWRPGTKHPTGQLKHVIGPVDNLDAYYEYQIYAKNLHYSMQSFMKKVDEYHPKALQCQPNKRMQDRTHFTGIIAIDPEGSQDYDDALGFQISDDGSWIFSIYIADVVEWLEQLDLWDHMTERVATLYLPNAKKTMLPPLLSDCLCSLQADEPRYAFVLDITVDPKTQSILKTIWSKAIIRVEDNVVYENTKFLNQSETYKKWKEFVQTKNAPSIVKRTHNPDSHEVVAEAMVMMNYFAAKELFHTKKQGIFRTATTECTLSPSSLDPFVTRWRSQTSGKYEAFSSEKNLRHSILGVDVYTHITSPIRRLVDVLNMIILSPEPSSKAQQFFKTWYSQVDRIQRDSKAIQRLQQESQLLQEVASLLDKSKWYEGIVLETDQEKGKSVIYLPHWKCVAFCQKTLDPDSVHWFRLFLFEEENRFRKKIQLAWIQEK